MIAKISIVKRMAIKMPFFFGRLNQFDGNLK